MRIVFATLAISVAVSAVACSEAREGFERGYRDGSEGRPPAPFSSPEPATEITEIPLDKAPAVESESPGPAENPASYEEVRAEAFVMTLGEIGISRGMTEMLLEHNLPQAICDDIDDGMDPMWIILDNSGDGDLFTTDEMAYIVGASVGGWCPEHTSEIDKWVN